jgi:hypothetical protein
MAKRGKSRPQSFPAQLGSPLGRHGRMSCIRAFICPNLCMRRYASESAPLCARPTKSKS